MKRNLPKLDLSDVQDVANCPPNSPVNPISVTFFAPPNTPVDKPKKEIYRYSISKALDHGNVIIKTNFKMR
jgi:hypothetical protein